MIIYEHIKLDDTIKKKQNKNKNQEAYVHIVIKIFFSTDVNGLRSFLEY